MQYFIGFFSGLVLIYTVAKLQHKHNILYHFPKNLLLPSQSHNHNLTFIAGFYEKKNKPEQETQSKLHDSRVHIKVIIMDDQAYWIKDNVFYTANMDGDSVNKDTTRTVDTMTMDKVQLDKMMFIIDRLRERDLDDSGGTGY